MRRKHFLGLGPNGFHRIAYTEWGDPANRRVLVCLHGLTRNSRDFEPLAQALAEEWRVICPDMPGRGDSEWLPAKADYNYHLYQSDCAALIARLDVDQVDWLGTSMGGVIGMALASRMGAPIRRLILNDIGPFVPGAALQRIAAFLGSDPRFRSLAEAEAALRKSMTTFGIRQPEHWRFVTEVSTEPAENGTYRLRYDPGIADTFKAALDDASFWPLWDNIRCPVLVLRGTESDLLLPETADEMTRRGPKADVVEIPACGHAPMLLEDEQITLVRDWLARE